jgi:hypothetical protein
MKRTKSKPQRSQDLERMKRLELVAQLRLRHCSYAEIRTQVMEKMKRDTYSKATVKEDIDACKAIWRESMESGESSAGMEVERAKDIIHELWSQYDISKQSTGIGDVRYIAEIRAHQQEIRKMLGLYAPEKKEVSGEISFASLLMESGMVESDAE